MSLVATFAIGGGHVSMGFVTLCALWNFAVNVMAETASQISVFAFDLLQLHDLLCVTGKTLIGEVVCQLDDLWRMRVVVTALTGRQIVVRFTAMALAASRDNFLDGWRMSDMAVLAANAALVGTAIGGNGLGSR